METLDWKERNVLITGGTGSFGKKFTEIILRDYHPKKLIIFSRDELKQHEMRRIYPDTGDSPMRYFIGDVRDRERLYRAFNGVDIVVHAAALKQVPVAEYNPSEFVKTNVDGAMNVIDAAIDCKVEKVISVSTDKAVNPVNLYGATKLCSDKLFVAGNVYVAQEDETRFSVVRYGNVLNSRGSIIPHWDKLLKDGAKSLPVTHMEMTRFWISLEQAAQFVLRCFGLMQGGEIFVPKITKMKIVDLAEKMAPGIKTDVMGVRPGEKIHEVLISKEEAASTYEADDHYVTFSKVFKEEKILSQYQLVSEQFEYSSKS